MSRNWSRKALPPSLILAGLLVCGLGAIWCIFWLMVITSLDSQFSSGSRTLAITEDGTALLRVYPPGSRLSLDASYFTLDGKRVEDVPRREFLSHRGMIPPEHYDPPGIRSQLDWSSRIAGFASRRSGSLVAWYLIHDGSEQGFAYFVGYDALAKVPVGYLAQDGFHTTLPAQEKWFAIPLEQFRDGAWEPRSASRGTEPSSIPSNQTKLFLVSDGKLLAIDFFEESVTMLPTPARVISLGTYAQRQGTDEGRTRTERTRIVVRLPHELLILSEEGEPLRSIPLDADFESWELVVYGTKTDEVIVQANSPVDRFAPTELAWFAADGKPLRRESVVVRERSPADPSAAWMLVGLVPVPVALAALAGISSVPAWNRGVSDDFVTNLSERVHDYWLPVVLLIALSVVLAAWAYRRQLRYEARGAGAWAAFVVLLGPFGLLAYLVHRSWPARTGCERCGLPTPRDRSHCLACAEPFAAPELRGIEIFA